MRIFFAMALVVGMSVPAFMSAARAQETAQETGQDTTVTESAAPGVTDLNEAQDIGYRPGRFVCYAVNARGERFAGEGFNRFQAERHAMRECHHHSRVCREAGCF